MRYEEARTVKEYGSYLEMRNQPGNARDQYNYAYKLFSLCGALTEQDMLKDKIDSETTLIYGNPTKQNKTGFSSSRLMNINQMRVDTLYDRWKRYLAAISSVTGT